jgi:TetR/AcrR family transcriptional repressor of nem operon
MARTRAFDETEALDQAMALFWEQGYEATSVRDLTARAGISSSSLYATFGDKHDVYLAALARYRVMEREQFAALLSASRAVRPTLADMFAELIDMLLADEGNRGSFSLNAAVELGDRDPEIAASLREHFDDVCALLTGRLAEAQAGGEIPDRHAAVDLARYLLFGVYSLATMVKVYPDRRRLESMAALLLSILDC